MARVAFVCENEDQYRCSDLNFEVDLMYQTKIKITDVEKNKASTVVPSSI
mgnify:FL=1